MILNLLITSQYLMSSGWAAVVARRVVKVWAR